MIAVFTLDQRQFSFNFTFHPRDKFKRITNVHDIEGRTFTGVITYTNWYNNRVLREAYETLEARQPELFK